MFVNKQNGEGKDAEFPKDEHHVSKLMRG
jgi:hypothetical protein